LSFGVFAMAFMVIFTLPVIPAWLYFLNSKKIIGDRKAPWYLNLGMVVCLIVLCYATYFSIGKMIKFMAG